MPILHHEPKATKDFRDPNLLRVVKMGLLWSMSWFLDKFWVDFFWFSGSHGGEPKFLDFLTGREIADAAVRSYAIVKHFNAFRDRVIPANSSLSHTPRDFDCDAVLQDT